MAAKVGRGLMAKATAQAKGTNPLANILAGANGDHMRLREWEVETLRPDPNQRRRFFDPIKLQDLADTIAEKGLLSPILVRIAEDGAPEIVAGERRWRAHKLLGRTHILGFLFEGDSKAVAMIENIQRDDLHPLEEARGYQALIEENGYTVREVATMLGKSNHTDVVRLLSLLKLAPQIQDEYEESHRDVSKSVMFELAGMGDGASQMAIWERIKAQGLSVKDMRAAKANPTTVAPSPESPPVISAGAEEAGQGVVVQSDAVLKAMKELSNTVKSMANSLAELRKTPTFLQPKDRKSLLALRKEIDALLQSSAEE